MDNPAGAAGANPMKTEEPPMGVRGSILSGACCVVVLALLNAPIRAGGGEANPENGRKLAESRCAHCHAVGATGPSPVKTAPAFRTLGRKWPVENLAESLAEGIVVGHPAMPAYAFSPQEIDDFLEWLAALQDK